MKNEKVITSPMDLGTVRRKVDRGGYTSFGALLSDMRLVAKNAIAFNHNPSDPAHKAAVELRKVATRSSSN